MEGAGGVGGVSGEETRNRSRRRFENKLAEKKERKRKHRRRWPGQKRNDNKELTFRHVADAEIA
jgi:hypothetical protein